MPEEKTFEHDENTKKLAFIGLIERNARALIRFVGLMERNSNLRSNHCQAHPNEVGESLLTRM